MKNVNCGRPSTYLDHKKPQQGRYEYAALTRLHATKMLAVKSAVGAECRGTPRSFKPSLRRRMKSAKDLRPDNLTAKAAREEAATKELR